MSIRIDLGTTYSCVGYELPPFVNSICELSLKCVGKSSVQQKGRVEILTNE